MPEFKDLLSGKWQSWWAFQFWIASSFQLLSNYGHGGFNLIQAAGAEGKAVNAMAIIATLAFFAFPIFYFITGCKMSQKLALVVGTCAYLVHISISTSWQTDNWQIGVGWAGWVNAVLATLYVFLDKSDEEKPENGISSVLVCSTLTFCFIGNYGFSAWDLVWSTPQLPSNYKAALIFDILGTAFAGFAVLFTYYNCCKGKMAGSALAALCLFIGACIWSSVYENDDSVTTNGFAFHWLAAISSVASVVLMAMKK